MVPLAPEQPEQPEQLQRRQQEPIALLDTARLERFLAARGLPSSLSRRLRKALLKADAERHLDPGREGIGQLLACTQLLQRYEIGSRCQQALRESSHVVAFTGRLSERRDCSSDAEPDQQQHTQKRKQATSKLVLDFGNNIYVESVIIRQKHWSTLCVSSQVGCKMGCRFCATGTMKKATNLNTAQILEQLMLARRIESSIRNVVFMGMGEPFDNYANVIAAVAAMTDRHLFALSPRHVCVSTVGVVSKMRRFSSDAPGVNLALSLHAPNQQLRERIVPTAKAYPIGKLMQALDEHIATSSKTKVLIECIVIKDVNDSMETAHELGALMSEGARRNRVTVNLIPYNPTDVPEAFEAPSEERVRCLQELLVHEFGVRCYTRREMGQEIASACGQLVLEASSAAAATTDGGIQDIEDVLRPRASKLNGGGGGLSRSRARKRADENSSDNSSIEAPPPYLLHVSVASLLVSILVSFIRLWMLF